MFSETVMEHFLHPRNVGTLDSPSAEGCAGSVADGVFVKIQLHVDRSYVRQARFQTFGCVPAIAASSYLTEWACGKSVSDVEAMNPSQLIQELGGLPRERYFCAELAVQALRQAVSAACSMEAAS
jgi:NifU-like protein involved in Fe-S cluster formation